MNETSFLRVSQEMNTLTMEKGESVSDYWARAQSIKDKCLEVDVPLNTKSFLGQVPEGLPRAGWGQLVMNKLDKLPVLTEEELLASLLAEEDRKKRNSRKGKDLDTGNAYNAGASKGRAPEGSRRPSPGRSRSPQGRLPPRDPFVPKVIGVDGKWGELGGPKPYCDGCHKVGHFWRECPQRPGTAVPKHLQRWLGTEQPPRTSASGSSGAG